MSKKISDFSLKQKECIPVRSYHWRFLVKHFKRAEMTRIGFKDGAHCHPAFDFRGKPNDILQAAKVIYSEIRVLLCWQISPREQK